MLSAASRGSCAPCGARTSQPTFLLDIPHPGFMMALGDPARPTGHSTGKSDSRPPVAPCGRRFSCLSEGPNYCTHFPPKREQDFVEATNEFVADEIALRRPPVY